jgi:hypothetical protein
VPSGTLDPALQSPSTFVSTQFHDELIADMIQSHLVKDFCIVGPRVSVFFSDLFLHTFSYFVCISGNFSGTINYFTLKMNLVSWPS